MTFAEIQEEMNAYTKRRQQEIKLQRQIYAEQIFYLAHLASRSFHDPNKLPKTLSEAFPGLWEKEKEADDWMLLKANMCALAKVHKKEGGPAS